MSFETPAAEVQARKERLRERLTREGCAGAVLFAAHSILYFTDWAFIPTERPVACFMDAEGTAALLVPRLEVEHARGAAQVDRVESYPEYPGEEHPAHLRGPRCVKDGEHLL